MTNKLLNLLGLFNLKGSPLDLRNYTSQPALQGNYSRRELNYSDCECDCDCQGTDCSECGGGDCSDCNCTSD